MTYIVMLDLLIAAYVQFVTKVKVQPYLYCPRVSEIARLMYFLFG
jgi:hypothetical protein